MFEYNSDYQFNNLGRIGYDNTDNSQRNIQNKRYADFTTTNYFSEKTTDSHEQFATSQPALLFNGVSGVGLNGNIIDFDSELRNRSQLERSFDKLQLNVRPFITVPYLGRGSCNPTVESQLLQGETVRDKKSVSTVMEQSFFDSKSSIKPMYPTEELALQGWNRGGASTRESGDKYLSR